MIGCFDKLSSFAKLRMIGCFDKLSTNGGWNREPEPEHAFSGLWPDPGAVRNLGVF